MLVLTALAEDDRDFHSGKPGYLVPLADSAKGSKVRVSGWSGTALSLSAPSLPRLEYRSLDKFPQGLLTTNLAKLSVSAFKPSGAMGLTWPEPYAGLRKQKTRCEVGSHTGLPCMNLEPERESVRGPTPQLTTTDLWDRRLNSSLGCAFMEPFLQVIGDRCFKA